MHYLAGAPLEFFPTVCSALSQYHAFEGKNSLQVCASAHTCSYVAAPLLSCPIPLLVGKATTTVHFSRTENRKKKNYKTKGEERQSTPVVCFTKNTVYFYQN